jgi:hypothetical protein
MPGQFRDGERILVDNVHVSAKAPESELDVL